MGLTHYPNGISVQASSAVTSAAGSGDLDVNNIYMDGNHIGSTVYLSGTLTVTSATASTIYLPTPIDGNIIDCIISSTAVSNIPITVRNGSAGTISVATVSAAISVVGGVDSPTLTTTTITTASAIQVLIGAAGTAGTVTALVGVQRTA